MVRYRNLGIDFNSQPQQYRVWITDDTPDLTGDQYTGPKSGDTPLLNISNYLVLDGYTVCDFNLPIPTQWYKTYKVLPDELADSQVAVIDGYIYAFGGQVTNKIYQASVANPADWIDTGATLPTVLYNSSLAVVNDIIYLFGGNTGDQSNQGVNATDTIFSASVNDPLIWTNHGSLLPNRIHSSSFGMADGYLYLFGGRENGGLTNIILTAPATNPLSWSIGPGTLPIALYGSTIIQNNGFWYLLGGKVFPDTDNNTIYSASITTPYTWFVDGYMPYPTSYGQFFPIGNDGYYIGSSSGAAATGFTTVLQASLSSITQWIDTKQVVPAVLSYSQSAIVYDRLWLFGGSGLSAIFACTQMVKYDFTNATVVAYGNTTRTVLQATDNADEPFLALTIPWWKTSYAL